LIHHSLLIFFEIDIRDFHALFLILYLLPLLYDPISLLFVDLSLLFDLGLVVCEFLGVTLILLKVSFEAGLL
jgi:hypothetical protein